ncbi:terminase [Streptomyces himalayensis]|uniref:Terminase n=1 Tax=Streptomyces himalayensis subsp. himalayensis TaxID=2756131 RepID=A0A7W0DUL5_9ACTN|nr:terminase [Streptomyces himalayensis]MBA2951596.1 terminase [Streptomyces himalayensis subsp. himalayensis]
MSSLVSERPAAAGPELRGVQTPRLFTAPVGFLSSSGQEAVELAALAGLQLDPWQQHILDVGLREREDGNWSAFEVAVNVPRQNGKGGIIEARELAGLFLLGEKLILHSAHEFKTSIVAFRRIEQLVMGCPDLRKRVLRVRKTTGEEAIELVTGQVLRFLARSGGSGRGFTGDCNILDEAMILGDDAMGALMPTMAAVPNPQIWYLGSAGIGSPSVQLGRLRRRAEAAVESGEPDPSLAYFEWSVDAHVSECGSACTEHDDADDPAAWARANPALGIRISREHIRNERASLGSGGIFERERLGVGVYPSDTADTWQVIGEDAWRALAAAESAPGDPVAFSIDMTPERSHAAICVAGEWRGGTHVEVVDHRPGTGWILDRAEELHKKWKPRCWVVDAGGPAGSLIPDLAERLGVEIVSPKAREVAAACGQFYDAVTEQTMSHLDQAPLASALAGAQKRPLGDAWAWARRIVSVDISPLVAVTLAKWGLGAEVDEEEEVEPWVAFR